MNMSWELNYAAFQNRFPGFTCFSASSFGIFHSAVTVVWPWFGSPCHSEWCTPLVWRYQSGPWREPGPGLTQGICHTEVWTTDMVSTTSVLTSWTLKVMTMKLSMAVRLIALIVSFQPSVELPAMVVLVREVSTVTRPAALSKILKKVSPMKLSWSRKSRRKSQNLWFSQRIAWALPKHMTKIEQTGFQFVLGPPDELLLHFSAKDRNLGFCCVHLQHFSARQLWRLMPQSMGCWASLCLIIMKSHFPFV